MLRLARLGSQPLAHCNFVQLSDMVADVEMLTTEQAARELGCTVSHVRKLARDGLIAQRFYSTRLVLYDRAEIERYRAIQHPRGWPRGKTRNREALKERS